MRRVHWMALMVAGAAAFVSGCSATGAAWEGIRIGKNLSEKDSYLKIWLDGQEAKQNKARKAYMGYAPFEVKGDVSTSPTFKFEFIDPSKFGRIKRTFISVYQEYEGDYSGHAEYSIHTVSDDPGVQMKPGETYNLGNPGASFRVTDFYDKEVSGISLKPGLKYTFLFTVTGDRNETVQIFFDTK